ncbi:MAG: glycosyltransferase [Ignavibacteriales bacterium]|nr:glycosyltransferase [Ignavibacteriales bacterium]
MKYFPKITVITPSYNQGQFLEETIRSVVEQNYPNLEYMVFDGGSTDSSVEIIKKYEKNISFWVSERDKGQTDAINKGFNKATGEIVTWLNSDDFYYPNALHLIAEMYNKYPEAGLYVGNGAIADKNGKRIRKYSNDLLFDFDILLKGSNYILQPSTFINSKAIKDLGFLDETLFYAMDLEYWLRVAQKYEVVTVNEELSAYRWYDEIKTKNGGIKRWVELWNIMRRYSKAHITPGLLVEFFNVLQEQDVINDLGFNIEDYAKENWQKFYLVMQKYLNTNDCIPIHSKGKVFVKEKPETKKVIPVQKEKTNHLNIIRSRGSNLKVDIVLPEGHSWFVREGYAEALKKFNVYGKSFYVSDKKDNKELYNYLKNPNADIMFLMNTEWHAQYLHKTYDWQKRWNENKLIKVLFSFECMNNPTIKGNNIWWSDNITAINNAMKTVQAVVYAHEIDEELFGNYGVPVLWQPFAIDENLFPEPKRYLSRKQKAFFKGKTTPFYYEKTYSKRRVIAQQLKQSNSFEIYEDYNWQSNRQFIEEMNEYQITLGLPSLSPTMVVRPFEAMGSGCVCFQNKVLGGKTNLLFEDGKNLLLYDENNIPELIEKVKYVIDNPEYGRQIAEAGYKEVMEKHTINNRVSGFLKWLEGNSLNIQPALQKEKNKEYNFSNKNKIAIDGVIFQLQKGRPYGISRVWISLLNEISKTELVKDIILLDRGGTAPKFTGIKSIAIKEYDHIKFESDSLYLQEVCDDNEVSLFISTYYTYPENTHNALLLHDMIPEILGLDLTKSEWRAKLKALAKANAYFGVSQNTIDDFRKLYPEYCDKKSYLVSNAVAGDFHPRKKSELENFKSKFNIKKPYFILVGNRLEYKNAILFFKAFAKLENKNEFEIFCTGGKPELESIFKSYLEGTKYQIQFLRDEELSVAYSGAVALVYPSKYEGFGLPILEAMKSGCPVITCKNSSIPEVAGKAAVFVDEDNVNEMQHALIEIQKLEIRNDLIEKGFVQSTKFSWEHSAKALKYAIEKIMDDVSGKKLNTSDPFDTYERVIYSLKSNAEFKKFDSDVSNLKKLFGMSNRIKNSEFISAEKILGKTNNNILVILEQLAKLDSTDGFIDYLIGSIYHYKNEKANALNSFLSALKKNFKHWRVYYLAACSAFDINKFDEAKLLVRKAIEQNQYFADAKILLEKIKKKNKREEFEVSAIVSTYNSEKFIEGCLKDLVEQTLYKKGELEIIVINSGSKQNEEVIIRKYQSKYKNINYLKTENRESIYAAWNRGIKAAKGKYITNANTDDRNRNDALEIKASTLDDNHQIGVVYADDYKTTDPNSTFSSLSKNETCVWANYDSDLLLFGCYIGPHPMWRKALHEKFGYFDENLQVTGDYEFWLRISNKTDFQHLNEFLGVYYYSENSAEHRDKKKTNLEKITLQKKYLCKFILNKTDLENVKEKILNLKSMESYKQYSNSALKMLVRREQGLLVEEQIRVFVNNNAIKITEKSFIKLIELIDNAKSENVFIDQVTYLPIILLLQATFYMSNREYEKAKTAFDEILLLEPQNEFAIKYSKKIEKLNSTIKELSNYTNDVSPVIKATFFEALGLYYTDNYFDSLNMFNKIEDELVESKLNQLSIQYELYKAKAFCLLNIGDLETAKQYFESALEMNPVSSEVCHGLGEVFLQAGIYETSKTMFEWAVKNDLQNSTAIDGLIKVNEILGLDRDHNSLFKSMDVADTNFEIVDNRTESEINL